MKDSQDKNLAKEELMQKNVAYYTVMFTAFLESRNEVDRQILTLSVASIGGLLAFHDRLISTNLNVCLLVAALAGFVITIGIILFIYDQNSDYIKSELGEEHQRAKKISANLKKYDRAVFLTFIISIIISATLIILSFRGNNKIQFDTDKNISGEVQMGNDKKNSNKIHKEGTYKNSISDAHLLKPSVKPAKPVATKPQGRNGAGNGKAINK